MNVVHIYVVIHIPKKLPRLQFRMFYIVPSLLYIYIMLLTEAQSAVECHERGMGA